MHRGDILNTAAVVILATDGRNVRYRRGTTFFLVLKTLANIFKRVIFWRHFFSAQFPTFSCEHPPTTHEIANIVFLHALVCVCVRECVHSLSKISRAVVIFFTKKKYQCNIRFFIQGTGMVFILECKKERERARATYQEQKASSINILQAYLWGQSNVDVFPDCD